MIRNVRKDMPVIFQKKKMTQIFFMRDFPRLCRPVLGPTQPHVQWVSCLSPGRSGRGVALTTHSI